jgi:hypothetical protein
MDLALLDEGNYKAYDQARNTQFEFDGSNQKLQFFFNLLTHGTENN